MNAHRQSLILTIACLMGVSPFTRAQSYERVDVGNQGELGNATAGSGDISDDGRFVVFTSAATNLGGSTVPGIPDVFLRDRLLGTTTVITSSDAAVGADLVSFAQPRISGDGSKVVFIRGQGSLPINQFRAYEYDRASGVTTQILAAGLTDIRVDGMDRVGNFVVITARTSFSAPQQVYRMQLGTGALVLCSRTMSGGPADSTRGDIDDDGRHVTFSSSSPSIVAGDTNAAEDVFVLDIPGNVMLLASVGVNGVPANGYSTAFSISGDGRYVLLRSGATNLMTGQSPQTIDFRRDLRLQVTEAASFVNVPLDPIDLVDRSYLSADGQSVAFTSLYPTNPSDHLVLDVYHRNFETGVFGPITFGHPGWFGLDGDKAIGLTRDGREVLMSSTIIGTAPGSGQLSGIVVAKLGPRCSSSGYCTSLPNSTGAAATIGAQGDASRTLNNLVIAGVGLPDAANAMLVSGTSAVDPGTPFGNGLMCIGGALIRHGIHVANGGVILDHQDLNAPEYAGVNPGDTRYYQIIYRDPPAGGANFNTTDAVAVTFCL